MTSTFNSVFEFQGAFGMGINTIVVDVVLVADRQADMQTRGLAQPVRWVHYVLGATLERRSVLNLAAGPSWRSVVTFAWPTNQSEGA